MTLRPPRDDDFDAMLELMNAHQLVAFGEADYTADDLRTWLRTPSVDVERHPRARAGRSPDRLRGRRPDPGGAAALVVRREGRADRERRRGRRRAVGWLEERARAGRLRVWTAETDRRIVDAFAALGFEPIRHSYRMEIDLADEHDEPAWPDGITVRTARPVITGRCTPP